MTISESEITNRFFESLNVLIADKKFKSIRAFCINNKLNYHNVMRMKYPEFNCKPTFEYLYILNTNYGINLNWVITGKGEIKQ